MFHKGFNINLIGSQGFDTTVGCLQWLSHGFCQWPWVSTKFLQNPYGFHWVLVRTIGISEGFSWKPFGFYFVITRVFVKTLAFHMVFAKSIEFHKGFNINLIVSQGSATTYSVHKVFDRVYKYACMSVGKHECYGRYVCTCWCVCMYVSIYACMYVWVHANTSMSLHVCLYI